MKISTVPSFGNSGIPAMPSVSTLSQLPEEGPPEPPPELPGDTFENGSDNHKFTVRDAMLVAVPMTILGGGSALGAYAGQSLAAAHPVVGMVAGGVVGLVGTALLGVMILNGPTC